jgi:Flp pilus assembly protein TadD
MLLFSLFLCLSCFFSFSCSTLIQETPLEVRAPVHTEAQVRSPESGSVADEIRSLTQLGTPTSLLNALDMITARGLERSEFGRAQTAVIVSFLKRLYPAARTPLPSADPPQTNPYTRILLNNERGIYTSPPQNSTDYIEYVLPFLALLSETREEPLLNVLPSLRRAQELNHQSVLAPYFLGLIYERLNRMVRATDSYKQAYLIATECYPAGLGLARVMDASGRKGEATALLEEMVVLFPDNITIKRQLALHYYHNKDWAKAEPAIAEILQHNTSEPNFLLLQAEVLVEQGQFFQAQPPLDRYASINPSNSLYLFLRARVQAEGYHNRNAALNYLRSILRASTAHPSGAVATLSSGDGTVSIDEVSIYATRLLLDSNQDAEQEEGRELLRRQLSKEAPSIKVIELAFQDAVHRNAWAEAEPYLDRLLGLSPSYLLSAYQVEQGLANHEAALSFAESYHTRFPEDEQGTIAYISALISLGHQAEAAKLIEARFSHVPDGEVKAEYYYLQSRIRTNEEAAVGDLRAALFENPRNRDALLALSEIYRRRKDERRAAYYLQLAEDIGNR